MNKIFQEKYNWKQNPFTLTINPNLYTGYEGQVKALMNHIENKHKIALLTGNTGSGKTMTLKWLEENVHENIFYISKPPVNPDTFIDIFVDYFPLTFLERILRKRPNLYTLPRYINKKVKGHVVFLVDEAHETNKEVLEWLRVLVDQIDNVSLVMAGLPNLDKKIKEQLETFDQRITTRITLNSLSESETLDLMEKRIASVGGSGTNPFTSEAITKIYQKTGGFPRSILKECDKLVNIVDKPMIDVDDVEMVPNVIQSDARLDQPNVTFSPKPPTEDQLKQLPYKQRKVLEILAKKDWITPTIIAEDLQGNYKSKGHAVRSVNNILRRLSLEGSVQREARGKAFIYALTPKIKPFFVEH